MLIYTRFLSIFINYFVFAGESAIVDYNTEIYLRKGKRKKIKSKIEEFTELHLIPYESKLKSAENIKELTNLKNKVSKIKARVSPKALKTLDSYKSRIIKQIDKKISSLKK